MKITIIIALIFFSHIAMIAMDIKMTKLNPNHKVTFTLPNGDKIRSLDAAENWFKLPKLENNSVTLSTNSKELKSSDRGKTWWNCKKNNNDNYPIIIDQELKLYPNPAKDLVVFELISDVKVNGLMSIFDTYGHKFRDNVIKIFEGNNLIEINIQDIAQGTYNLNILVNGSVRSASFVVIK
jgi:hypothetical protein